MALASRASAGHVDHALLQFLAGPRKLALHLLRGPAQFVGSGGEAPAGLGDGAVTSLTQARRLPRNVFVRAVRRSLHPFSRAPAVPPRTPSIARCPSATAASRIVSNCPMAFRARLLGPLAERLGRASATRFSALLSASASTSGRSCRRLFGRPAHRFGHSVTRCSATAQRLADAAGSAPRRLLGDAGQALAQPEQLGGKRGDLAPAPLASRLRSACSPAWPVVSSVRSTDRVATLVMRCLGGAERLRQAASSAGSAALDRLGLLRKACAIASSASRRSTSPACIISLVSESREADVRERLRLRAELRRHRRDVAQHVGRDVAQRLHLVRQAAHATGRCRAPPPPARRAACRPGRKASTRCWRAGGPVAEHASAVPDSSPPGGRPSPATRCGPARWCRLHRLHDGARLRAERVEQPPHIGRQALLWNLLALLADGLDDAAALAYELARPDVSRCWSRSSSRVRAVAPTLSTMPFERRSTLSSSARLRVSSAASSGSDCGRGLREAPGRAFDALESAAGPRIERVSSGSGRGSRLRDVAARVSRPSSRRALVRVLERGRAAMRAFGRGRRTPGNGPRAFAQGERARSSPSSRTWARARDPR